MFKIIESSSAGNCFKYGNLMIDLGLPYSKTKEHLSDVTHILLTHIHGDHLNMTTVRKIFVAHENIRFICGQWLIEKLIKSGVDKDRILLIEFGKVYQLGDYKISPVMAYHDVENCGYRILFNGIKHLHITDTCTLEGIEAKGYNTASIEANHHYETALELIEKAKDDGEFSHLRGAINSHLDVKKTIQFCKINKIGKLFPIHIGSSTKKEVIEVLKRW